ncbi:MAG: hydrogenase maturation nickel metallochaperone HypA [Anaerolineales bacterium]|nr:hydrogenase maturation nickel metallochaperone HypA [Anaerolineales bacterium]MCB9128440.1 hydrogenase maturation nickel metallochaperone HypA [Ardenticatenales bacterium]
MHEYALVQAHVDALNERLAQEGSPALLRVHFRYGPTLMEAALRQAWEVATQGTALAEAQLALEPAIAPTRCDCGQVMRSEDVDFAAHLWLCPACERLHPIDEARDLQLIEAEVDG